LAALSTANAVRRARAHLKRDIADGTLSAADALDDPPPLTGGCPIGELLVSQRGWGRVRCHKFLATSQINEAKRIDELTLRQRRLLADQLRLLGRQDLSNAAET
jgi:hypothetical protein